MLNFLMLKMNQRDKNWLLRDKYYDVETPAFFADLKRLAKGEPLDYVIGWREFLGVKIDLSERPLIPREETEFWVRQVVGEIGQRQVKILDIFSGSGCIGLAVLKNCPKAKVTLADVEDHCLRQIKKNLRLNRFDPTRFSVKKADIFSGLSGRFDLILANPPYVAKQGRGSKVQRTTLRWEPASALWAGADGLDIIRSFLASAKKYLAPKGQIWLEFGVGQKTKIARILKAENHSQWRFARDQFGRWRLVVVSAD